MVAVPDQKNPPTPALEEPPHIFTMIPRDGGIWLSADDWLTFIADLYELGVEARSLPQPGSAKIRFKIAPAPAH